MTAEYGIRYIEINSTTEFNIEEVMNVIVNDHYERIAKYKNIREKQEESKCHQFVLKYAKPIKFIVSSYLFSQPIVALFLLFADDAFKTTNFWALLGSYILALFINIVILLICVYIKILSFGGFMIRKPFKYS